MTHHYLFGYPRIIDGTYGLFLLDIRILSWLILLQINYSGIKIGSALTQLQYTSLGKKICPVKSAGDPVYL